ncbi:MAG: ATP-binding cassette domain-containing protein, partial [Elusimicrobiota bacterium]|nr:ATP-binding cassette domain-containing protein [Elusimicrobiota bacterium]
MIEINNLTKTFGSFKAVDGLSLRVEPGEIFGFLGPNGAGKTTTVKILSGIMRPTSGSVSVAGFDLATDP